MRILTLTNLYPTPLDPGRAPFNRQQLRALAARLAVSVIAPVAWTDELARWWRGRALGRHRRVCDGIGVKHPRYLFPPKVLRGCYGACYRWSVSRAFRQALEQFRPDLVFAPWAYPDGWAAIELGHRAGLPVVLKVHGGDVLGLDAYPARRARTAEALQRADGVVAVSSDLATRVVALGAAPGRVRVVYDGVNHTMFRPGPVEAARARLKLEDNGPLILFVGRLVPVKGLEVLIEACARLAAAGTRFDCRLIGEGCLRPKLERQIARHHLHDRVRLLGGLPHGRLPDWYRAARVFVLPSYSEGVPSVLLEATACGTPFVASAVGGIPEIRHLGDGELVLPGDAAALTAALGRRLANTSAHSGVASRVRSLDEAAAELSDYFDEIAWDHVRDVREIEPRLRLHHLPLSPA